MLENVLQNAKARGYITSKEVLELYPQVEQYVRQVDELFAKLFDEGVQVLFEIGRAHV